MDVLKNLGEIGIGSRLKRVSDYMMRETQLVYHNFDIDFDPYLFPAFKIITSKNGVTNTEITHSLHISQPATTQAINKLLKKELIVLKPDKIDKRKKVIMLSKKGEALVKVITPIWHSIEFIIKEYTTIHSNSLVENLSILEEKFKAKPFSTAIIEHIKMNPQNTHTLQITDFKKEYATHFYDLNIEWLKSYFYVEPYDEKVLGNPAKYIIDKGGHIFFAKINTEIVGTVALMPRNKGVYELTKMAVSPKHRGYKIGQHLMQKCIDFATSNNFDKLMLYSNTKLENAIYIYKKYGFIEIPVEENSPYKRSDIKMELKIQA